MPVFHSGFDPQPPTVISEKSWMVNSVSPDKMKTEPDKPITREDIRSESLNFIYFLDSFNCEQISCIRCQIFFIQCCVSLP